MTLWMYFNRLESFNTLPTNTLESFGAYRIRTCDILYAYFVFFFWVYIHNSRKAQFHIDNNQSYKAMATTATAIGTSNRQNPQTNIFMKRWSNRYAFILTLYRQTQVSNKTDFSIHLNFSLDLIIIVGWFKLY